MKSTKTRLAFIKCFDPIGRQEKNTLKVFQQAQEDADESIPVDIMNASLLQEYVCFVQQEQCAPAVCNVKDVLQLFL